MPALWSYVTKVYAKMEDEAKVEQVGEEESDTALVYTGHLTALFQGMNIPNPYYTHVTRMLKAMGCAQQLRRGGGPSTSKWALVAEPTEEAFTAAEAGKPTQRKKGQYAILEQRIRDLVSRVATLEAIVRQGDKAA